ncbi:GNAT family N-acetyltransferase [Dictyobacter arantiisoli]|uniref:GNAT family N-acetyltransferase n=1 Tax=Dictyobacter arantiisoli TaxID=2014874 RepID=UPI00155A6EAC|nr:GNAT family N-acetyltransferase [Dictyobacter arantiisoli]
MARLIYICDEDAFKPGENGEETLKASWQQHYFCLSSDAWMIVAKPDELVGYADVRPEPDSAFQAFIQTLYVHPKYQNRGIETLLVRLGEERARQLSTQASSRLRIAVRSDNRLLSDTIQLEGYQLVRQFLRVNVTRAQLALQTLGASAEQITLDVALPLANGKNTLSEQRRLAVSTVTQYDIYEKVSGTGSMQAVEQVSSLQCTLVG